MHENSDAGLTWNGGGDEMPSI